VRRRDGRRQAEEHRDAAEQRLREDEADREPTEGPQAAVLGQLAPPLEHDRERQRQDDDRERGEAVAVLDEHATLHVRHQRAVAGRPVGAGEARPRAVDEPADEDEQIGRDRRDDREPVKQHFGRTYSRNGGPWRPNAPISG
jgi:hypothetical protein